MGQNAAHLDGKFLLYDFPQKEEMIKRGEMAHSGLDFHGADTSLSLPHSKPGMGLVKAQREVKGNFRYCKDKEKGANYD